jgi:hypothetical protein
MGGMAVGVGVCDGSGDACSRHPAVAFDKADLHLLQRDQEFHFTDNGLIIGTASIQHPVLLVTASTTFVSWVFFFVFAPRDMMHCSTVNSIQGGKQHYVQYMEFFKSASLDASIAHSRCNTTFLHTRRLEAHMQSSF